MFRNLLWRAVWFVNTRSRSLSRFSRSADAVCCWPLSLRSIRVDACFGSLPYLSGDWGIGGGAVGAA